MATITETTDETANQTEINPKAAVLAYRWEMLAWVLENFGDNLDWQDDAPIGVVPLLGKAPTIQQMDLKDFVKTGGFDRSNADGEGRRGFNMAAAVAIVSSLDVDTGTITIPKTDEPTAGPQATNIAERMGIRSEYLQDQTAMWYPLKKEWGIYRKRKDLLAQAARALAEQAKETTDGMFREKQVFGVLSATAAAAPATEIAQQAALRREQREATLSDDHPKITKADLGLPGRAQIVAQIVRSDPDSMVEWTQRRAEEQWIGASMAGTFMGLGYDKPQQGYEKLLKGSAPTRVTNGMVAGTERQEEVIKSTIASLEEEGWKVERRLPPDVEDTVAFSKDRLWDVATVDCVLELEDAKTGKKELVALETKVPSDMSFNNTYHITTVDADGKTSKEFAVPTPVTAQAQDQMRIYGYKKAIVSVMNPTHAEAREDGNVSVTYVFVEKDPELQKQLAQAKEAGHRCWATGTPPSSDSEYYASFHPQDVGVPAVAGAFAEEGAVAVASDEDLQDIAELVRIQENEKKPVMDKESAAWAKVDSIIGVAEKVVDSNGEVIATKTGRDAIDRDAFLADPDVKKFYLPGKAKKDENVDMVVTLTNNPVARKKYEGTAKTSPRRNIKNSFKERVITGSV